MIVDSIYRQFLVSNKYLIRISTLEDRLGITGKSIHKWVVGKKPLPSKWEEPLKSILFPMVDEQNKFHKMIYKTDKVVVLLESQVLVQFCSLHHSELKLCHFSKYGLSLKDLSILIDLDQIEYEGDTFHNTYTYNGNFASVLLGYRYIF